VVASIHCFAGADIIDAICGSLLPFYLTLFVLNCVFAYFSRQQYYRALDDGRPTQRQLGGSSLVIDVGFDAVCYLWGSH
jgi:hypothetical protein